ncbi:hypothetical protein [Paraglaciecola arctica]|uniref:hypothetical protein n=1 Tax=Paraglaciecola arctica TaxID=1128911 RepID=UPI001C072BA1|nr:hypothetical protein [Paraglaciecola arctica]MBU3005034.1 hypothetical protein [Paraglaciecola arctica]
MADLSWIDIVDTAVKVGFGALASGLATYKVTKLRLSHENKKIVFENKVAILCDIVRCVEESTNIINDFSHKSRSISLPSGSEQVLIESEKLMKGYTKMGEAQGLSHMLGLDKMSLEIDKLCSSLNSLYCLIADSPANFDINNATEKILVINASLTALRKETAEAYSSIGI